MKIASPAAFVSLRGALLCTALASMVGAQTQLWTQEFGSNATTDRISAATPDGAGGVYVGGFTEGFLAGPNAGLGDVWLAHYDNAGNQIWVQQFGTSAGDGLGAAAPDGSGGVYFCGHTEGFIAGQNAGSFDVWLAHYDSAGNRAWILQFGTGALDLAWAAAPDGSGGVYVSGYTEGDLAGLNAGLGDVWLAHYDSAGNQTWIQQFGTSANDLLRAVAPDGSGGVYLSGSTRGNFAGQNAGLGDVWLAHYDSAGNQTWIQQFGTTANDWGRAVAPDGSGGIYLSGSTGGSLAGPNAGEDDVWLAHYDSAGNQTWIQQFGTTAYDWMGAAAPDGSGGVYLSGATAGNIAGQSAGPGNVWLAHYDSAGNQAWILQFGPTGSEDVWSAAPNGSGGVFVGGFTSDPVGGQWNLWLAHYEDFVATQYCTPAIPNSAGQLGVLIATGSNAVVDNYLTVEASQLSTNAFGFFLTSQAQGTVTQPGGSQGTLCLGGTIGRYVGPGQIQNAGSAGAFSLTLDLTSVPTPTGFVAVQPGETWNFQAWYRDANPGPTSNFTGALSVTFL